MNGVCRRYGLLALFVVIILFFWSGAVRAGLEAMQLPSVTSLRYSTPEITMTQLKKIRESQKTTAGDRTPFSAFTQLDGQSVTAEEYKKSIESTVLLFSGDIRLIVNPTGINGSFTTSADAQGCALDADTAYRLWGSENILGEKLEYKNNDYFVRAVFRSPSATVLIPLPENTEQKLSAISLDTRGSGNPRGAAEDFRSRYGLAQADAVITGDWMTGAARLLMVLPALTVGLLLLLQLLRELWAVRHMPFLFALWLLVIAVALALIVWASGIKLSMPQSLIPTRWSDFAFWKRTFTDWWINMRRIFASPRLIPDLVVAGIFARMLIFSLISTAALLFALRTPRGKRPREASTSLSVI